MKNEPFRNYLALYQTTQTVRDWWEDVMAHLSHGYVINTPAIFILARPVCSWAEHEIINDVWNSFDDSVADTWYIYAVATAEMTSPAGLVKKTIAHMPYFLPYCAWERVRDKRLRFFRTEKFLQNL